MQTTHSSGNIYIYIYIYLSRYTSIYVQLITAAKVKLVKSNNRAMMTRIDELARINAKQVAKKKLGRSNLIIALFRRVNLTNNYTCK